MKEILTYILENQVPILSTATTIVTAASAICAMTPTPKDDKFVGKAYKFIEWLGLNFGKAKQSGKS